MKAYMLLNENMMDGRNNIQYKIGESYKHDKGFLIFNICPNPLDIILSNDYHDNKKIIEVTLDDNFDDDEGFFNTSKLTVVQEISKDDIIHIMRSFMLDQVKMLDKNLENMQEMFKTVNIDNIQPSITRRSKEDTKKIADNCSRALNKIIRDNK